MAFTDGGRTIAGCGSRAVSPVTGRATCPVTYPGAGMHPIRAVYSGNASFGTSTSPALSQQVAYAVRLLYSTSTAHVSGSTVPIRVALLGAAGNNLSSRGIAVTVTGLTPSPAPGVAPTGAFTFEPRGPNGPSYLLNVRTLRFPPGTYTLSFTAGADPTTHTAPFVVKRQHPAASA